MQTTSTRVLEIFMSNVKGGDLTDKGAKAIADLKGLTAADLGISSVEAQGLLDRVADEFGVEISAEDAAKFASVQDLADYLDARA